MCRFSIIVPLIGDSDINHFEDSLASVLRHRPDESQIIVVHDGSYADPYGLSDEVQMVAADSGSHLIEMLNVGMCYAAGEFTLVVRPGVEIDENWHIPVQHEFESAETASVTPILVVDESPGKILSAGVCTGRAFTRKHVGVGTKISNRQTASLSPDGPSLWLAAYRTDVLKTLTPFDETLEPMYLDLELALTLQNLGFRSSLSSDFVGTMGTGHTVTDEIHQPHGIAAQRAIQRFNGSPSMSIADWFMEIAQAPFSSNVFKHTAQRSKAKRFRSEDRRYFRLLAQLKSLQPWIAARQEDAAVNDMSRLRRAA